MLEWAARNTSRPGSVNPVGKHMAEHLLPRWMNTEIKRHGLRLLPILLTVQRKVLPPPPLGAGDFVVSQPRARFASPWAIFHRRSAAETFEASRTSESTSLVLLVLACVIVVLSAGPASAQLRPLVIKNARILFDDGKLSDATSIKVSGGKIAAVAAIRNEWRIENGEGGNRYQPQFEA